VVRSRMVDVRNHRQTKNMITDIFLKIVATFISFISNALAGLGSIFPDQFTGAVEYFIGHLGYLSGVLNFPDIFQAFGTFVLFTSMWYTMKLVLWVFSLIPAFGKKVSPKI